MDVQHLISRETKLSFSIISRSSKFAVEGLSKSIAYELEPFGIKVVLVEPGLIRTNLYNNSVVASKSSHIYVHRSGKWYSISRG